MWYFYQRNVSVTTHYFFCLRRGDPGPQTAPRRENAPRVRRAVFPGTRIPRLQIQTYFPLSPGTPSCCSTLESHFPFLKIWFT